MGLHYTDIHYNRMNLPEVITFDNGNQIVYLYDASGAKLSNKTYTNNTLGVTTEYSGGFVYEDQSLSFFGFGEGRVRNVWGQLEYQYDYKDHLGNVRATFRNFGGYPQLIQADDYYPFGLKMSDYSLTVSYDGGSENKFTYNGKELEDEFGLNWYHYGARFYDPTVGRWWAVDPLDVERSTYVYSFNNPIRYLDPDGASPLDIVVRDMNGVEVYTIKSEIWDGEITLEKYSRGDPFPKAPVNYSLGPILDGLGTPEQYDASIFSVSASFTPGLGIGGGIDLIIPTRGEYENDLIWYSNTSANKGIDMSVSAFSGYLIMTDRNIQMDLQTFEGDADIYTFTASLPQAKYLSGGFQKIVAKNYEGLLVGGSLGLDLKVSGGESSSTSKLLFHIPSGDGLFSPYKNYNIDTKLPVSGSITNNVTGSKVEINK